MQQDRLIDLATQCISLNEVGGTPSLIYRFSDADGRRTGRSGYSFGLCQFDIENNWDGINCLQECGFTPKELKRLFLQDDDIKDLNAKLASRKSTVDRYDRRHIYVAVKHCQRLVHSYGLHLANDETLLHIIDYHNQFHFTENGKLHTWLQSLVGEITPEQILDFKKTQTLWGTKRPDDVDRRFRNIQHLYYREMER